MEHDLDRRCMLGASLAAATLPGAAVLGASPKPRVDVFSLLRADGPHPSLGKHADTFGRLIGAWEGEHTQLAAPSGPITGQLAVYMDWVLEGHAVQDLFIFFMPGVSRMLPPHGTAAAFGTTLRFCDPKTGLWKIHYTDPANQSVGDLVAERIGDDIIQIGTLGGAITKWNFTNITPRSFIWRAHELQPDGQTWRMKEEYHLRRIHA
jgi:hypothetical protein